MKHPKIKLATLSFLIIVFACSAISIISAAENQRWMLESINPMNGVDAIAFVISYLMHLGPMVSYSIIANVLVLLWWLIYIVMRRLAKGLGKI